MYLATWALQVQLFMAMLTPVVFCMGAPKNDDLGGVKIAVPKGASFGVTVGITAVYYVFLVIMFLGAMAVVVALYTMTPENLPPYAGYTGLVPGVKIPPPPSSSLF